MMPRELVIRAADHGVTYLTWRWLDDPQKVGHAVLDRAALSAVIDELNCALPHPLPDESDRDAVHRALRHGGFADPFRELALAVRLAAVVLPAALAGQFTTAGGTARFRLRVTPSPRLARVPWELLVLPDGRRLVEVADVVHDPPATVHAQRDRRPVGWHRLADQPVVYLLDPRSGDPRLRSVLDEWICGELEEWLDHRQAVGRILPGDLCMVLRGGVGRRWLGERLRGHASSRLVYYGHASAADAEPGSAAIHLADPAHEYGLARPLGDHRPFTALDLLLGTLDADDMPVDERVPGHLIWPMPPRVAIIACDSGGDYRHLEPFGLVLACLNAGAELVTATNWTLPTDQAFRMVHPEKVELTDGPTTDLMRQVDRCHELSDPVAGLTEWQLGRLAAWTADGDVRDTPLLWAALTNHVAPARPEVLQP